MSELAKCLSAGFDSARVHDIFLDVACAMAKCSRAALLVASETGTRFSITAHRGLAPHLVTSVRLAADAGLPLWLAARGRPAHAPEAYAEAGESLPREVVQELRILQAVVAVPILSAGELVAILVLGARITGVGYLRREVELLFELGAQIASVIRHWQRHHRLRDQNVFTERILSHLPGGVVAIDEREKVVVMNRRAEEILELSASQILDRDLRRLPSPLGDLLYETMRTGRTTYPLEVLLAHPKLPLKVSTTPIESTGSIVGAAVVFDDLSAAKQLSAAERHRDLRELLVRLVGRMAADVRSPLLSIGTLVELFERRFEDAEFREQFTLAMRHDIRRLVEILEGLPALVSESGPSFDAIDIRKVIETCLADLDGELGSRVLDEKITPPVL